MGMGVDKFHKFQNTGSGLFPSLEFRTRSRQQFTVTVAQHPGAGTGQDHHGALQLFVGPKITEPFGRHRPCFLPIPGVVGRLSAAGRPLRNPHPATQGFEHLHRGHGCVGVKLVHKTRDKKIDLLYGEGLRRQHRFRMDFHEECEAYGPENKFRSQNTGPKTRPNCASSRSIDL